MPRNEMLASVYFQAYCLCRQQGDDHNTASSNAKAVVEEAKQLYHAPSSA